MMLESDPQKTVQAKHNRLNFGCLIEAVNRRTKAERFGPETSAKVLEVAIECYELMQDKPLCIEDYLDAVIFVAFRSMGYPVRQSYAQARKHQYIDLGARATSEEEIDRETTAFATRRLVREMEVIATSAAVLHPEQ